MLYRACHIPVSYTHLDVYKRQALSRADVRSAITALAKIVREEMLSGRTVDLANLGSFKVVSNGKRVETEKAVTAETLKTPRIQFFPKLEMRNQAKNVQHVVIRESEAGSAKPSPNLSLIHI